MALELPSKMLLYCTYHLYTKKFQKKKYLYKDFYTEISKKIKNIYLYNKYLLKITVILILQYYFLISAIQYQAFRDHFCNLLPWTERKSSVYGVRGRADLYFVGFLIFEFFVIKLIFIVEYQCQRAYFHFWFLILVRPVPVYYTVAMSGIITTHFFSVHSCTMNQHRK